MRQQKYSKLIQKELSDIFVRDKRGILGNSFITIMEVRMSPDLSVAKVYVSMTLAKDKAVVLDKLNTRKPEIRKALGDKSVTRRALYLSLFFLLMRLSKVLSESKT